MLVLNSILHYYQVSSPHMAETDQALHEERLPTLGLGRQHILQLLYMSTCLVF